MRQWNICQCKYGILKLFEMLIYFKKCQLTLTHLDIEMVMHLKRTWISLGDFLCQHKYPKYCFGISVVVSTSWCGQFWNEDQHQFLFRETIENILSCYRKRYKNVWIYSATKSVPVYWGHYSIVEVKNPFLLDKLSTEI